MYDFDGGEILAFRKCGLLYCNIGAHVGWDPLSVYIVKRNVVMDLIGPLSRTT